MTVGITYVDGPRLARSVFAAADWVAAGREEINRISVFSVADALRALGDAPLSDTAGMDVASERDFQYCTEVLVRGEGLPPANEVRAAMHAFGGSTVVALMGDILEIHVHTDTPGAVFNYASRWGRNRPGAVAGDLRHYHLPGPGGAQAGGVLSAAARGHPAPHDIAAHADAPEAAGRICAALVKKYQPQDCFVSLAAGVLGTHVGPGAWGIYYQVEDGPTSPAGQGGPQDE
ncbi:MAG TPA: hypothetical protein VGP44_11210 [Gemmatimonadales bacterium]|nr:hypothetical protein [Gemmatimonadales bacterium]